MIFKKKTLSCTNQPMKSVSWLIVSIHPLWNLSYLHPYSIAQTPMLKSSVDWIETVSCSSVTELSSASPEPTTIPFRYRCINNPNLRGADDDAEICATPLKEKKYVPDFGAVKTPDAKFIAPPVLSFSISNGIGELVEWYKVPFVVHNGIQSTEGVPQYPEIRTGRWHLPTNCCLSGAF